MIDAQTLFNFTEMSELKAEETAEVMEYIERRKLELRTEFFKMRQSNAQRIVKDHTRFKNPYLINFEKLATDYEKMWVCPMFLRPGKNDFVIRTAHDTELQAKLEAGDYVDLEDYQTE